MFHGRVVAGVMQPDFRDPGHPAPEGGGNLLEADPYPSTDRDLGPEERQAWVARGSSCRTWRTNRAPRSASAAPPDRPAGAMVVRLLRQRPPGPCGDRQAAPTAVSARPARRAGSRTRLGQRQDAAVVARPLSPGQVPGSETGSSSKGPPGPAVTCGVDRSQMVDSSPRRAPALRIRSRSRPLMSSSALHREAMCLTGLAPQHRRPMLARRRRTTRLATASVARSAACPGARRAGPWRRGRQPLGRRN